MQVGACEAAAVQDAELADLVATDLAAHLAGRAGELDGPAYAVCLWIELGELVVSIATEPGFARRRAVPAYRDIPDEQLRAPAGIRWPSGGWDAAPEPFVSVETLAALAPLAAHIPQKKNLHPLIFFRRPTQRPAPAAEKPIEGGGRVDLP